MFNLIVFFLHMGPGHPKIKHFSNIIFHHFSWQNQMPVFAGAVLNNQSK